MSSFRCWNGYSRIILAIIGILGAMSIGYGVWFQITTNEENIQEIKKEFGPRIENTEYWVIKIAERIGIKEDTRKRN